MGWTTQDRLRRRQVRMIGPTPSPDRGAARGPDALDGDPRSRCLGCLEGLECKAGIRLSDGQGDEISWAAETANRLGEPLMVIVASPAASSDRWWQERTFFRQQASWGAFHA
jgi:hypothetical protein